MDTTGIELSILTALREPTDAIAYSVSRQLASMYPDRAVVEGSSGSIDLLDFAAAGLCSMRAKPGVHSQIVSNWNEDGKGLSESAGNGWYEVEWDGHRLEVLLVSWQQQFQQRATVWIVADSKEIGQGFYVAISEWCAEVRGEIVVFEGGCWHKSRELFQSVQSANFDNLILTDTLKAEIQADFKDFFASRSHYEQYGVPWKRGVLFYGPPGNGKTHTLKALINWLGEPCLYVKSFKPQRYETDHEMIRRVFDRARQTTPCLLVLEDLDSLIDASNRSFFLNELDGFASNTGIVVLATTNHPERLDPAILDRPSRFDRKYAFSLPTPEERLTYLRLWNERSKPEIRLSDAGLTAMVERTETFSFAYLKELWLSSMMRWIASPEPGTMDSVMEAQVATLLEQMVTPISEPAPETDDGNDFQKMLRSFMP